MQPRLIEELRRRHGYTQKQMATLARVQERAWQRWEAGDRMMPAATFELICIKLDERVWFREVYERVMGEAPPDPELEG